MPIKPRLRVATADDAAAVHEVYEYYIHHSVATFSEANQSVERHAEAIAAILKEYPFLVAEGADGAFLGFANAEPVRPQSGYRFCAEMTIYLNPSAPRHAGIGSLLYQRLLEILAAQGFRLAYGVVSATNAESIALHRRFGFQEVARFRRCGYKHGLWLDAVWMEKVLNPFDDEPKPPIPFEAYRRTLEI